MSVSINAQVENDIKPSKSGSAKKIISTVKHYQFSVFYEQEISLWNSDENIRKKLLANREKYLGKTADELTWHELMLGFRISGMHMGYTSYDCSLMQYVLDRYDIHSVFDPCAGWGERLLCCASKGVAYFGVDINPKLSVGYYNMIREMKLHDGIPFSKQCNFMCMPSESCVPNTEYDPRNLGQRQYDAVITCPPYFDKEIYSFYGAENKSYQDFLAWWDKVVANCADFTKYFCFTINRKCLPDMQSIVISHGYEFKEFIPYKQSRSSHLTRSKGVDHKTEFEAMYVFKKVGKTTECDTDDQPKTLSERIKYMRKVSGMSQAVFAERFGIPNQSLKKWEQGCQNPPEYVVSMMEEILGLKKG